MSTAIGESRVVVTACPATAPSGNRLPLIYGRVIHSPEGESGYPDPDWEQHQGSRRRVRNDFELADFRAARIECRFGTQDNRYGVTAIYPVPGLLLSCESVINEPPDRPYPPIWEHFACTSRVE
ncbi:MAG: hypothetical protein LCH62_19130 [Proteobacteria bacterium]|nr:hypothetical protein [Pseudomonadota bacterium]